MSLSQANSLQGDPRSNTGNNAPATPPVIKSSLKKQSPENAEIYINGSLSVSGNVHYMMYTVTLVDSEATLPNSVDPDNPPHDGDPRIKKYKRPKPKLPDITSPLPNKLITFPNVPSAGNAAKTEATQSQPPPDPRVRRLMSDSASESSPEPLPAFKAETFKPEMSEFREKPIDSGLPKLLDPRYGRKLSVGSERKDVIGSLGMGGEKPGQSTAGIQSPPATGATPAKPAFSHRNDPRFKKKTKDSPGNRSDSQKDNGGGSSASAMEGASSSIATTVSMDTSSSSGESSNTSSTGRMEFASPLGNLDDGKETDQYGAYGRPDRSRPKLPPYAAVAQPERPPELPSYAAVTQPERPPEPFSEEHRQQEAATEGESAENVRSMFTSIDPTASPFC